MKKVHGDLILLCAGAAALAMFATPVLFAGTDTEPVMLTTSATPAVLFRR